jgi:hypothetical protein
MFTFRRPTEERIKDYLSSLKNTLLSPAPFGCTRNEQPDLTEDQSRDY